MRHVSCTRGREYRYFVLFFCYNYKFVFAKNKKRGERRCWFGLASESEKRGGNNGRGIWKYHDEEEEEGTPLSFGSSKAISQKRTAKSPPAATKQQLQFSQFPQQQEQDQQKRCSPRRRRGRTQGEETQAPGRSQFPSPEPNIISQFPTLQFRSQQEAQDYWPSPNGAFHCYNFQLQSPLTFSVFCCSDLWALHVRTPIFIYFFILLLSFGNSRVILLVFLFLFNFILWWTRWTGNQCVCLLVWPFRFSIFVLFNLYLGEIFMWGTGTGGG